MKRKASVFTTIFIFIIGIISGFYISYHYRTKNITLMKNFLTTLFTATKYESLDTIIPEDFPNELVEMLKDLGDYHIDYREVKNSMLEEEFNYLVANRFITRVPKVANQLDAPSTINNIVITQKKDSLYNFEVSLCIKDTCGIIKGEISMEKRGKEWIVTHLYLDTNSLK